MKIDYVINLIPQQRTRARFAEIERIKHLAAETKTKFQNIETLDRATNNPPEYIDSNVLVPGLMTMYLLDSPFSIVMP
jgi:hypothetical protein